MRYSIPVKFVAVLLAAVALTVVCISTFGIWQVAELGLYTDGFDSWLSNGMGWQAYDLAKNLTNWFAVRELTNCPEEFLEELGYWYVFEESIHWTGLSEDSYNYSICDSKGNVLASKNGLPVDIDGWEYQTILSVEFPVQVTTVELVEEIYGTEYLYKEKVYSALYDNKPVTVRYYKSPEYTVKIALNPDAVMDRSGSSLQLLQLVYEQRYTLMVLLPVALIVLAAAVVYLCCAAGKTKILDRPDPGGLNRIPLDVYALAGGAGCYLLGLLAYEMVTNWIFNMNRLNAGTLMLVWLVLLCMGLIVVGFIFALSAQLKMKHAYWWKRSLMRVIWKELRFLGGLLPVIWHYLLPGMILIGLMIAGAAVYANSGKLWLLLIGVGFFLVAILYSSYALGIIVQGAEKIASGDLEHKISTQFLMGSYAHCARYLNDLADVASAAAEKQMQSERLKAELITNVSHDIKTPLTSVINYVDLLQKTEDAQAGAQYLEVLGRQSQRLKKLIDDLMEMSKASTGNITVDMIRLDPVETVNQALGEFADKLEAQQLEVVFSRPEEPLAIYADGRLMWRIISNLLSNIVKYAMPGTRMYVDMVSLEDRVLISLKNISKEPLNISADELMERFVRSDPSRNTEGSGLGLNIAKSLMELQKGQLELLIDGDLFKATMVFSKAQ